MNQVKTTTHLLYGTGKFCAKMQIVSQDSVCIVSDFYQVTEEMHFKSAILLYKLSDINDKGRKSFTVVLSGSKMS